MDLGFFAELSQSLGAKGDFAAAYVIAHEIGHHVQNILGIESAVRQKQQLVDEVGKNKLSVKMELQADCMAGIWAALTQQSKNVIEEGDIDEAAIERHLDTADMPPLDLVIRTSGEQRLSNFLLWQAAYAEFWFTETLWPDFGPQEFGRALEEFGTRNRRYGGR